MNAWIIPIPSSNVMYPMWAGITNRKVAVLAFRSWATA